MTDDHLEPFDAISWCWGEASAVNQKNITVGKYTLSVPANAYEVLVELCVAQKRKRIWIDAVCMNQNDIHEKSQQVAMMDTIYQRATMTLVWLGKDKGTARRAKEMIRRIADWRQVKLPFISGTDEEEYGLFADERQTDAFPLNIDWDALTSLFSAVWFTRIWIIQEVVLSKHCHLFMGKTEICWKQLAQVMWYISNNIERTKLGERGKSGVWNAVIIGRTQKRRLGPLELLESSPDFGATNPKDRIFALYGLLKTDTRTALHTAFYPNYDAKLVDIYTKATRATLNFSHGARLLLHAQCLVQRPGCEYYDIDFPSWVPRYHFIDDRQRGSYRPLWFTQHSVAQAHAQIIKIDRDTPSNILRIAGAVMDTVSTVFEPLSPLLSHQGQSPHDSCGRVGCSDPLCVEHREAIFGSLRQLWHAAIAANPKLPLSELATMLRTTLVGKPDEESCESGCDCYLNFQSEFKELVTKVWPTEHNAPVEAEAVEIEAQVDPDDSDLDDEYSDDDDDDEEDTKLDQVDTGKNDSLGHLWHRIIGRHANRRFFLAGSGRTGIAAPQTQVGDKICLVPGLEVPLILRQVGSDWVLIGDAYLSGTLNVWYRLLHHMIEKLANPAQGKHIDSLSAEEEQWFNLR
ncbi:hypothetical protein PFICI_07453 [Pestalotiopsis fici W106-1]|uniref:Heterokaryon incompatibility domain-containing protein n=1 Tax=Pestalotiopsis fici (strain W106-1 / CGMCC3.15140) TaxID=1229662 RepID=W3X1N2_PESFW|nr:uncharacterized protein PFICI_07453 [Pestalotiopsis fici W106-1]ETS79924.1 hypothetical protein PFICI_07453 [Pestalotiopsis fici W106-1]